jgi:hypothetical protein
MTDKQKKIVIFNTTTHDNSNFILPEGAYVEHFEGWVLVFENSWQSRGNPPIFKYKTSEKDAVIVSYVSEDEELVEKIKKLDKAGMDMLRNMMGSADLLK